MFMSINGNIIILSLHAFFPIKFFVFFFIIFFRKLSNGSCFAKNGLAITQYKESEICSPFFLILSLQFTQSTFCKQKMKRTSFAFVCSCYQLLINTNLFDSYVLFASTTTQHFPTTKKNNTFSHYICSEK